MRSIISIIMALVIVVSLSCIVCADTRDDSDVQFTLDQLGELFPGAKEDIDNYLVISKNDNIDRNNRNRVLLEEKTYTTTKDGIEYTLIVYDNGYLGLSFDSYDRGLKTFSYYVWGMYQELHQLVASVNYYVDGSGNECMTSMGAGGSGIHLHSYSVNSVSYAFAKANAYYVPEGWDPLEVDYFGMLLEIKRNSSGTLYKETTMCDVF